MTRREWRWVGSVVLLLVLASCLPYLVAWRVAPDGMRFTGLLVNPMDGHSYIAKMRQGLDGAFRFRLVFTPERQEGAHLFLLHLALGHVARWFGLPLIAVYHGARILAGGGMVLVAYRFTALLEPEDRQRRLALALLGASSGLGWLVAPASYAVTAEGYLPADLWVPEAYLFYSVLDTLHFPLAIALMMVILWTLTRTPLKPGWRWGLVAAVASVVLGVVQPFGVIPVYAALALWLGLRWWRDRRVEWNRVGWIGLTGLVAVIYPLYGVLAIRADPVLAGWSVQNQTPSPPVWDWLLSFGLMTVLAVPGAVVAGRRRSDGDLLLLAWVAAAGVGMYTPLALQRRLALGLQVPVALLATLGWWQVVRPRVRPRRRQPLAVLWVALSTLTYLFLMATLVLGAIGGESLFFLWKEEWRAMVWLRENVPAEEVVLCSPETGMFVPAWAGQRVVYGHPFETVDAARREAQVLAFWAGEMGPAERRTFLQENRVGYALVGPRELALMGEGQEWEPTGWKLVFAERNVRVYRISDG